MGERAEQGEALWYVGPGCVEIRTETVVPPAAGGLGFLAVPEMYAISDRFPSGGTSPMLLMTRCEGM